MINNFNSKEQVMRFLMLSLMATLIYLTLVGLITLSVFTLISAVIFFVRCANAYLGSK